MNFAFKKKNVGYDFIDSDFKDPNIVEAFREFARNQWSEENILAYLDIQLYKTMIKKNPISDLNVTIEKIILGYYTAPEDQRLH